MSTEKPAGEAVEPERGTWLLLMIVSCGALAFLCLLVILVIPLGIPVAAWNWLRSRLRRRSS